MCIRQGSVEKAGRENEPVAYHKSQRKWIMELGRSKLAVWASRLETQRASGVLPVSGLEDLNPRELILQMKCQGSLLESFLQPGQPVLFIQWLPF